MPKTFNTIFQKIDHAFSGNWGGPNEPTQQHVYDMSNKVIYKTKDKEKYDAKKLELQQNKFLKDRWVRANNSLAVEAFAGLSNVKLMYRDADLMDAFPEIGAALDIVAEESSITNDQGKVVNVYSQSTRTKVILEDLFVNRLNLQIMAPMVIRAMCKYGNQFMLLDIDREVGVKGWRQLPVFNVERLENGINNPYSSGGYSLAVNPSDIDKNDLSTKFVWLDENSSQVPFRNWQVAHFRLLTNSLYLPYGVSYLNSARRHWRMLSLMEDMMLIYRLERSVERRVYKIFVGAIDDADVQAYVEEIANNFKRTPIIDPMTGQVDLRKNILPVHKDTPIPLLDGRTITIEQLAKEYEEGKQNFVYSIQDDTLKVVPGTVAWCGKNYTADKLVKITLDDGSYSIMAPEHEVVMRDGSKKRADELVSGESVMPFYRKVDKDSKKLFDRYEKIYNPGNGKYEFTHRLIAEGINKENDSYNTVHHKNFNKTEYIESVKKNHKVYSIEYVGGDDVYCMTVLGPNGEDDRHNFALRTWRQDGSVNESGMFVRNCIDNDIFIPVRDPNAPNPIDTLSAGQNLTAMDDIKFVQKKVCAGMRIPMSFLNFEDSQGKENNLALQDVRFTRTVNRIQQAFLMELTKVASIHLYLLGFKDELTNFTLTMNNPSTQAEQLQVENIAKKIGACRDAVSDPGNGIPVMSQMRALKQIMHWSDDEIKENLEEIRLEKAIAMELNNTAQIIQRTGVFDNVDRIYGEPGAQYQQAAGGEQGGEPGGGGGGGFGGGMDFGGGLEDIGAPGGPEGELGGMEGTEPTADMGGAQEPSMGGNEGGAPEPPASGPNEGLLSRRGKPLLTESKTTVMDDLFKKYISKLKTRKNESLNERVAIYDKALKINEEFNTMISDLDEMVNED